MGHRVFLDFKRWTKGVYHGLHRKRVQRHVDESAFRWNRIRHRRASIDSLLGIGLALPPATYRDIVDGRTWRGESAGTPCPRSVRAPAGRLCHPEFPAFPRRQGCLAAALARYSQRSGEPAARTPPQHLVAPSPRG